MDLMGYLCGDFVKRKGRDQTDDTALDSSRYSDQIRISQWFASRKPKYTAADHLKCSDITHGIKSARMDASTQRLSCTQYATMFLENSNCSFEPGALPICLHRHFDKITFTC
jgi:hypothetical protein